MTMYSKILEDQLKVECLTYDQKNAVKLLLAEARSMDYQMKTINSKLEEIAKLFEVSFDFLRTYFGWLALSKESIMVFFDTDSHRFDRRSGNQYLPKNSLMVAMISQKGAMCFSRPELSESKKDELLTVLQESLYMVGEWKTYALAILQNEVLVF